MLQQQVAVIRFGEGFFVQAPLAEKPGPFAEQGLIAPGPFLQGLQLRFIEGVFFDVLQGYFGPRVEFAQDAPAGVAGTQVVDVLHIRVGLSAPGLLC